MIIVLKKGQKLTKEDFDKARKDYRTYIKITVDIDREIVVLGGEYHSDAEKLLLEAGSKQADIWGGGVNLVTKEFETNSMINIRPGKNDSPEILDAETRKRFIRLGKIVLSDYV